MKSKKIVWVDGSGYSGISSAYCVISNNKKYLKVFEEKIEAPNIEYLAILAGLEISDKNSVIFSDCLNLVKELNLLRKPSNLKMFNLCRKLMLEKNIEVVWTSRDINKAGIYLQDRLKKLNRNAIEVMNPKPNPELKKEKKKKHFSKKW